MGRLLNSLAWAAIVWLETVLWVVALSSAARVVLTTDWL
jgi:hypothetical protein